MKKKDVAFLLALHCLCGCSGQVHLDPFNYSKPADEIIKTNQRLSNIEQWILKVQDTVKNKSPDARKK